MTCPICSFETGHYVCSRAPVVSLVEELAKNNKALLEAAKNIENDDGRIPAPLWDQLQEAIAQAEGK